MVEGAEKMKDKIIRIFTCKNGHEYESKEPVTTDWAEINLPPQLKVKANDKCKFCKEIIISEQDYVNEKVVMGAVRIEK